MKVHQLRYWIRKFKPENESAKKKMQWLSVEIGELEADKPQEALPVRVVKATIEVRPGFDPKHSTMSLRRYLSLDAGLAGLRQ